MLRELWKKTARYRRHRRRYYQDYFFRRVNEKKLERFLTDLGLRDGMLLYVQSSFGSLGYYPDGPSRFIRLLLSMLGPKGTLVMPSFPFKGAMEDFLRSRPAFHVMSTPSLTGLLTETLRQFPGAGRSLHPTHPVCAVGYRAEELVRGHQTCETPQGDGSPFARLVDWQAHVLRIHTRAFPFCHRLQEAVGYPNLFLPEQTVLQCTDEHGQIHQVETRVYRRRVPFVFYMDGSSPETPVATNIVDFPLLMPGTADSLVSEAPERKPAVQRLLKILGDFEARGEFTAGQFNQRVWDLFPLSPVFSFAEDEMRSLLKRHEAHYEPERLQEGLDRGSISI